MRYDLWLGAQACGARAKCLKIMMFSGYDVGVGLYFSRSSSKPVLRTKGFSTRKCISQAAPASARAAVCTDASRHSVLLESPERLPFLFSCVVSFSLNFGTLRQ